MEQIRYLRQKSLVPLLNELLTSLVIEKPDEPLDYMLRRLATIKDDVQLARQTTKERRNRRDEAIAAAREAAGCKADTVTAAPVEAPRLLPRLPQQRTLPFVLAAIGESDGDSRFSLCRQLVSLQGDAGGVSAAIPAPQNGAAPTPARSVVRAARPLLTQFFEHLEPFGLRPCTLALSRAAQSSSSETNALNTLLLCGEGGGEKSLVGLALISKLLVEDKTSQDPSGTPPSIAAKATAPSAATTTSSSLSVAQPYLSSLVRGCMSAGEQQQYPNLCLLLAEPELHDDRRNEAPPLTGSSTILQALATAAGSPTAYPNIALLGSLMPNTCGESAASSVDSLHHLRLLVDTDPHVSAHPLLELLLSTK